ncbi:nucleotidyltransferase family protein [Methanonatronarchaeum sp. AMET-Sl]|uniref:nucleotidyltransferase family protein n=1 Tax=Methanonatronarchaeum sp. AMET-Sl TaxID=3037654 RepID=UPI00244E5264|nr:nucleotidyltransferase family protein [Methanonatronarchaeum sp. AMET-Sl]WGI18131.1 nucleotidyltransferase family protein [Methanonatronarchaeum sp. AMET-Sl]
MVERAVIPAAGKGTRLKPITDAIPKEMIRVGRKPTIEHVLTVLKKGGIEKVLIIVGRKKSAIIDYLGSGERLGIDVYYRVQEKPKGTAHAISLAEDFIQNDFVIMYGDNYITPYNTMEDIINYHEQKNSQGTLVLDKVEDPRRFGIVDIDQKGKVHGMIEKPTMEEAKPYKRNDHWLNIAGLMVMNPKIFDYINQINPGKQGELWLTDAIEKMRKKENKLYGYIFNGTRYDIGTFESLKKADIQAQKSNK